MSEDAFKFLGQSLKFPNRVGGIWPSSRALAEVMVSPVNFNVAKTVVEIGPGTGPITSVIVDRLQPATRYVGIELNGEFCRMLAEQFRGLQFVNDNAEHIGAILANLGMPAADAVICSLPWAMFDEPTQIRLLAAIRDATAPGGLFVTFAYLQGLALPSAWALRRLLKSHFPAVKTTQIVWNNLPPAFAYVCRR